MKTLIIFTLTVVIGLAVIGAGPSSFIDDVKSGGMFVFSAINSDSAFAALEEISQDVTPVIETVEKNTSLLGQISDNTIQLLSDNETKEKLAEIEVHRLINLEREKYGLQTLQYDEKLASVAKLHSIDMADDEYFAHETPEGLTPTDRASKSDYTCQYQIGNLIYSGIGENLYMVQGTTVSFTYTPQSIAESAVSGWMDSPGHKKNILTSNFSKEGIGVSISEFTIHVTENFC